ncbi:SIR2 family anti-phage-associated protein [Burkholderia pseudomallei]|uniref:SIR2 family anti-phage-associated protein n=1 Tax=Burkholderia pseudomallei TaxID=28450 RepID=UPI0007C7203D|nr:SIR2 family anti-phage-associated protein [Burkholderia pseudomallei]
MAITAVRGTNPISDEIELQAHLATLLRLENVGLLLAAGASVAAGGKTMFGLWDDFVLQHPDAGQWLDEHRFIDEAALAAPDDRVRPNVEQLVDTLEIALSEWRREERAEVPELETARAALFRSVVRAALLQESWWASPAGVEADEERLKHHRTILQKLVAARQPGQASPWVFTTNYDLAVEWAAESIDLQVVNGFIGTHSRRFSPQSFDMGFRNTQARGEARFGVYNVYLAKLHGSLSWREEGGQVFEVPAPLAWQQIRPFLEDATKTDLGMMVLPRAAKYMQTVGFVLGELFRRFSEFLSKAQTCLLVSGYGFGDEHINRLLRSALLNPTLQLVIYFPEFTGDIAAANLPDALRKLLSLNNPRVTVVGGGANAYLDKVAAHLPDPLLYDQEMRRLEELLRKANDSSDASGEADIEGLI